MENYNVYGTPSVFNERAIFYKGITVFTDENGNQIQLKSKTAAEWTSENPILLAGEIGLESDTRRFKFGDGTTDWINLPYASVQGTQGGQGVQGLQGLQGTQGVQGPLSNFQGTQGLQGSQGIQNAQGTQGLQGIQGTQGVQGPLSNFQGTQGTQGVQNAQGLQGLQGLQGTQGTQGVQGLQGVQGTQGVQGPLSNFQGTQGGQGVQGLQGTQGTQGVQGLQGDQGVQGVQGVQGMQGVQGLQGTQGMQANQGTQGLQGTQGVQGPLSNFQGTQGLQGVQNSQGTQGTQGAQGPQGVQGMQGTQGLKGEVGATLFVADDLTTTDLRYPTFLDITSGVTSTAYVSSKELVYVPATGSLGIGTTAITKTLTVGGAVTATEYYGDGVNLVGIVTQLVSGIGIDLFASQSEGKGVVKVQSYRPVGKTIFVSQTGDDNNTGLAENYPKRTIKSAASVALTGDTIKVFPGSYIESNPIILAKRVSIEGTELRNCIITPLYPDRDLFYVNNSVHMTNLSFIGPDMTNGAAVVALQPLSGVATDRFFDAARMIRMNLDYIANETVGFITSTQYQSPAFNIGISSISLCARDIKLIWKSIIFDITRGGNSKSVNAGLFYYNGANLQYIVGVSTATIDALQYSAGIARAIINNVTWGSNPVGSPISVTNAVYNNVVGITTITAASHGLSKNDAVKIVGLGFTCPSGPGIVTYPSGKSGYIFNVKNVVGVNTFEVIVGQSTLPHTYVSGGTIQKYTNFQNNYTQIKDLGMQADPITGFNAGINGCANVVSAIYSCVGVVTSIIKNSPSILGVGFNTTYPGNLGIGFTTTLGVTSAIYDNTTGDTTLKIPGLSVVPGDSIEIYGLKFSCNSGGGISTQTFPSGAYGNEFYVNKINNDGSFVINTGVSTITHNYVGSGYAINRSIGIATATYDNTTGLAVITAPGAYVKNGNIVTLIGLNFSCPSGPGIVTYPSGKFGYNFPVTQVIGYGTTFTVNVGTSTLPHTYVGGGVVKPVYSRGVGPITQGPYIRNCTNFIGKSIGMKVDGFNAEPGDKDDIGVTGTMSVDSYTQYNQGGIGVSISNGAYAQLVSIFTICDDIGIYTESGGQCDITNSNASFGNYGLVSNGVGNQTTKSIYRYSGNVVQEAEIETDTIIISGIGTQRPYDGQAIYFDKLYYQIDTIQVTNGGGGYSDTNPPTVVIDAPTGPSGITAEASANVVNGQVVSIDVISSGSQYLTAPNITFTNTFGGAGAAATTILYPLYYSIQSATLPSAGISTVVLVQNLNNTVSAGSTVYFSRLSLQIATSISLEWVGSGTDINSAKPALGGVTIQANEVDKRNGGQIVYTSTNQAGNFQIGDGVVINQLTGTISGRAFSQSLLNTVTPLIIALT
jgi:hypothetical protein